MLTLYYVSYKCLTAIGVLALGDDEAHITYGVIVIAQAVLALWFRTSPPANLPSLRIGFTAWPTARVGLWPAFGLLFISMAVLFWQIGVPTLADDPNVAKTMLQEHPLLIRWYRFFLPACIVLMICGIRSSGHYQLNLKHISFIAFGLLVGILLGFKGFILTYILIPLLIAVAGNFRFPVSRLVLLGLFGTVASILLAAFIERLSVIEAAIFFATRITVVQALGPSQTLQEIDSLQGYNVLSHDLSTALYRMGIDGGAAQSFNAYMFERVMGENPYGMEVTVPFALGFMIQFGFAGLVVASFIETMLAVFLFRKSASCGVRGDSPIMYTVLVLVSMAFIDAALNGVLAIRALDFTISLLFFAPFIIFINRGMLPGIKGTRPSLPRPTT